MFLISKFRPPCVSPSDDLGVKKGWSVTYGKKHMPKPKELLAFASAGAPYRTIASWYNVASLRASRLKTHQQNLKAKVKIIRRRKRTVDTHKAQTQELKMLTRLYFLA